MSAPYVVRSTGPSEADVVDRATGKRVGWVRTDFWGRWEAFTHLGPPTWVSPSYRWGSLHRYRADAARAVWEESR